MALFFINVISCRYIRTGEFDRFLLRPVNLLFQITIDSLDEDGWGELLLGLVLVLAAYSRLGLPLWKLPLLVPLALSGCAVLVAISLLLSAVSFISIGGVPVMELMVKMFEFTKYPVNIFSQSLKVILTCVLPLGFATYYPSLVFLGSHTLIYPARPALRLFARVPCLEYLKLYSSGVSSKELGMSNQRYYGRKLLSPTGGWTRLSVIFLKSPVYK